VEGGGAGAARKKMGVECEQADSVECEEEGLLRLSEF
jgi:hypothetical protein